MSTRRVLFSSFQHPMDMSCAMFSEGFFERPRASLSNLNIALSVASGTEDIANRTNFFRDCYETDKKLGLENSKLHNL